MSEDDYYSFRRHEIKEIMHNDYGIIYEDNNAFSIEFCDCYNMYMDSVMGSKYGLDLDKKCKLKVDSMNAIEQQNALKFYGDWDKVMDSLLGVKVLTNKCKIMAGTISLKLEIDSSGVVHNATVNEGFCEGFDKELIKVIKYILWTPGTGITGKKTNATGLLKLIFNDHKLQSFEAYFY